MNKRIQNLRTLLKESDIAAMLISSKTNRRYLSGFTGTSAHLYVSAKRAVIVTDFRYFEQLKQQSPEFEVLAHDGNPIQSIAALFSEEGGSQLAVEAEHIKLSEYFALEDLLSKDHIVRSEGFIETVRMTKEADEIEKIKRACEITDKTYAHILDYIKPGMTEKAVASYLDYHGRCQGADGAAFETIVASGVRSSMPHGHASDKPIEKGDMVTIDFGVTYDGYYSDMTRSFGIGNVDPKLREIYEIVRIAQQTAVDTAKPEMLAHEVDAICRDYITEAGFGDYFGHGTGHGVGMDCHELPIINQKGEILIKPSMIFTIEPGIYLPNLGGVRIEDDVLVTDSGVEQLTKSPKEWIQL